MNDTTAKFRLLPALFLFFVGIVGDPLAAQDLPNVVIIYADDLGYGDLSCFNADAAYQTPNLDRMARDGIRFVDAHSPCTICSPSRYGLLTGNLVCRTGRRPVAFEGPGGPSFMRPGELTLASMLKSRGYRTGIFGKWHLGLSWFDSSGNRLGGGFQNATRIDYAVSTPLTDGPNTFGFDESFVTPNCPCTDPLYVYIENGFVPVPADRRHRRDTLPNPGGKWRWDNDEGWMAPNYDFVNADLIFMERTLDFIKDHRARHPQQPFFVILSTQIAHAPVLPAEPYNGVTEAGPRGDFVAELDAITGRVLETLENLGIADDTLVIFNSDNGPETLHTCWMREDHGHDPAGGWRGMKRDGWEGGHRVPLIVKWPRRIPAGRVSKQLINTTDLMATLASVVGFALPDDAAVDSFDMSPVLYGVHPESEALRPWMLTQSFRGEFQLRVGEWKYLAHRGSGGNNYDNPKLRPYALPDPLANAPAQLYQLDRDPGETKNLYFDQPDRVRKMEELLRKATKQDRRTAPKSRQPFVVPAAGR